MKKLLLLLVVLTSVFALSACGEKEDLIPNNVLRVGMDLRWPPFETIDTDGKPTGISVDLAYELGRYLDMKVEIVDLEFGSLITALETNEIDIIIGSMSITEDRALKINFSDPYFYFPLITVLNKDFADANPVTTREELFAIDGVKFVGPKSFVSLSIPQAEALNPVINEVNDSNAAILEVVAGTSDAFIISASSAAGYAAANPDTTVLLWDPITSSPIGMGMRKGDTQLLADVNAFIAKLNTTGGVYDRLGLLYDDVIAEVLPGQGLSFYTEE
jgi:polar amino acid transport system substrate-binding protein